MVDFNKHKLSELCNEIKARLIEEGKSRYVVMIASTNIDFMNVDDDLYEKLCDKYNENGLDCETRLVCYDCGGYSRTLQLDGVVIENDNLYFYLTEIEMSYDGDKDIKTYKIDLDRVLDEKCWWMAGGNPVVKFRFDEVLEFYVNTLSEENCEFII